MELAQNPDLDWTRSDRCSLVLKPRDGVTIALLEREDDNLLAIRNGDTITLLVLNWDYLPRDVFPILTEDNARQMLTADNIERLCLYGIFTEEEYAAIAKKSVRE